MEYLDFLLGISLVMAVMVTVIAYKKTHLKAHH